MSVSFGKGPGESVPLADELVAELQAALPQAVAAAVVRMQTARNLCAQINGHGLVRRPAYKPGAVQLTAVCVSGKIKPSMSGWVFGVLGVAASIRLGDDQPLVWSRPLSRCGLFLGGNAAKRLRWQRAVLTYHLLSEVLQMTPRAQAVLVDGGLVLRRDHMPGKLDDGPESDEWTEFRDTADAFWTLASQTCYPFCQEGPIIAGVIQRGAPPVFRALAEDKQFRVSPDELSDAARAWLRANARAIGQVGPLSLLQGTLKPGMRSLAFSYGALDLDDRLEPARLIGELGLLGCALSPGGDEVWEVELPGTATEWTVDRLDELAGLVAASCLQLKHQIPVPLWYARARSDFPEAILHHFERALRSELRRLGEEAT